MLNLTTICHAGQRLYLMPTLSRRTATNDTTVTQDSQNNNLSAKWDVRLYELSSTFGYGVIYRDSTRMGTGAVPTGTTSLQFCLGTFFVPALNRAKRGR